MKKNAFRRPRFCRNFIKVDKAEERKNGIYNACISLDRNNNRGRTNYLQSNAESLDSPKNVRCNYVSLKFVNATCALFYKILEIPGMRLLESYALKFRRPSRVAQTSQRGGILRIEKCCIFANF